MHPRAQGDLGEVSAMEWLASVGARVFVPIGHSPDCDLVADLAGRLVKHFSPLRTDFLLAHVADGRRWFIPADRIMGGTRIVLGGPKYAAFEVEPARPFDPARAGTG